MSILQDAVSYLQGKSLEKRDKKGSEMESIKTAMQVWNGEKAELWRRRPGEDDYRELCRALSGAIVRELRQTGGCTFLNWLEEDVGVDLLEDVGTGGTPDQIGVVDVPGPVGQGAQHFSRDREFPDDRIQVVVHFFHIYHIFLWIFQLHCAKIN